MSREQIILKHFEANLPRFKAKTTVTPEGCWVYTGRNSRGYGTDIAPSGNSYYLHKASNAFFNRGNYSDWALHKQCCTNPACWNPAHLYSGTPQQNALDRVEFGKPLARLDDTEVVFLKFLIQAGFTDDLLAEIFEVSAGCCSKIRNNRRRRNVVLPESMLQLAQKIRAEMRRSTLKTPGNRAA
jgi:hypothetical protein